MSKFENLNPNQLEAVMCTEGPVRLDAGPGSGKTNVVIHRTAFLINVCGIDPSNILIVTFTKNAAQEIKQRLEKLIGYKSSFVMVYTYHGFGVEVLKEDIDKFFLDKKFQIIDRNKQNDILAEIYKKHDLKLDYASFEYISKEIAKIKKDREYIYGIMNTENEPILDEYDGFDKEVIEEYLQYQKQHSALDFNDLLHFTIELFHQHPEVLEKWQKRINYIMVDEVQDTTNPEMYLIDMLAKGHGNLFVVGDPDQNIFEWRGSNVNLFIEFDKNHKNTKSITLDQNYRSTPQIINCANSLISKNSFRLDKTIFTLNPDGESVVHYHLTNEQEEAEKIASLIKEIKEKHGDRLSDFAILYRSSSLSRVIEKVFVKHGIPYEIVGSVKFYERQVVRDILAYLHLLAFDDDTSFKRIISKPARRFGEAKIEHLAKLQSDKSLYQTLKENINDPVFKSSKANEFIDVIERARILLETMSVYECVETLLSESGYEAYIRERGSEEDLEILYEFKRIVYEYEVNNEGDVTLEDLLNNIALQSADNGEEAPDKVKLMTIHTSKGKEFPNVFVLGFSERVFPSSKTLEERKNRGLEEERRLCYVALTRAMKRLFIFDSECYGDSNEKCKLPSRFLNEIGIENYTRIGTISRELQWRADDYIRSHCGETFFKETFRIGDIVKHPIFGVGEIVIADNFQRKYEVFFEKIKDSRVITAEFLSQCKENCE